MASGLCPFVARSPVLRLAELASLLDQDLGSRPRLRAVATTMLALARGPIESLGDCSDWIAHTRMVRAGESVEGDQCGGMLVMLVGLSEVEWFLMSHRWELHSRFLDLVEPHLENTLRDWEQAIEQQAEELDDDDTRDMFYDFHSDEYHERLEFKGILMNSFFFGFICFIRESVDMDLPERPGQFGQPLLSQGPPFLFPCRPCHNIPPEAWCTSPCGYSGVARNHHIPRDQEQDHARRRRASS